MSFFSDADVCSCPDEDLLTSSVLDETEGWLTTRPPPNIFEPSPRYQEPAVPGAAFDAEFEAQGLTSEKSPDIDTLPANLWENFTNISSGTDDGRLPGNSMSVVANETGHGTNHHLGTPNDVIPEIRPTCFLSDGKEGQMRDEPCDAIGYAPDDTFSNSLDWQLRSTANAITPNADPAPTIDPFSLLLEPPPICPTPSWYTLSAGSLRPHDFLQEQSRDTGARPASIPPSIGELTFITPAPSKAQHHQISGSETILPSRALCTPLKSLRTKDGLHSLAAGPAHRLKRPMAHDEALAGASNPTSAIGFPCPEGAGLPPGAPAAAFHTFSVKEGPMPPSKRRKAFTPHRRQQVGVVRKLTACLNCRHAKVAVCQNSLSLARFANFRYE
jgi:hypothetical protein